MASPGLTEKKLLLLLPLIALALRCHSGGDAMFKEKAEIMGTTFTLTLPGADRKTDAPEVHEVLEVEDPDSPPAEEPVEDRIEAIEATEAAESEESKRPRFRIIRPGDAGN